MTAGYADDGDRTEKLVRRYRACSDDWKISVSMLMSKYQAETLLVVTRFLPNPARSIILAGCLPIFLFDFSSSLAET